MSAPDKLHIPVLLSEVLAALSPKDGGVYVDGTFGAGGYSAAILEAADCKVIGIDRDPNAIALAADMKKKYGERLVLINACFSQMAEVVSGKVDGVALDLGVSSMQIDNADRGFSFQKDGDLDMRMSGEGMTAADVVNTLPEAELADIIYEYGQERFSRKVAAAIAARRKDMPFTSTLDLAGVVAAIVPRAKDGIHPATRTFQALRIYVNDELDELQKGLAAGAALLKPSGRLAVVSFHSLEDRIVKAFMQEKAGKVPVASRYIPIRNEQLGQDFQLFTKKPLVPSEEEVRLNPRSRSAKLRVLEKKERGDR